MKVKNPTYSQMIDSWRILRGERRTSRKHRASLGVRLETCLLMSTISCQRARPRPLGGAGGDPAAPTGDITLTEKNHPSTHRFFAAFSATSSGRRRMSLRAIPRCSTSGGASRLNSASAESPTNCGFLTQGNRRENAMSNAHNSSLRRMPAKTSALEPAYLRPSQQCCRSCGSRDLEVGAAAGTIQWFNCRACGHMWTEPTKTT